MRSVSNFVFYYIKLNFILFFVKGKMLVYKWVDNVWASQKDACALIYDIFHPPPPQQILPSDESQYMAQLSTPPSSYPTRKRARKTREGLTSKLVTYHTLFFHSIHPSLWYTQNKYHIYYSLFICRIGSIFWLTLFIVCCRTSFFSFFFLIGKSLHLTQNANTIKKQKFILFY